jgi:hypothetical protein
MLTPIAWPRCDRTEGDGQMVLIKFRDDSDLAGDATTGLTDQYEGISFRVPVGACNSPMVPVRVAHRSKSTPPTEGSEKVATTFSSLV